MTDTKFEAVIEITHQQWINDYAVETGRVTTLTLEQTRSILDAEGVDAIEQFAMYGEGDLSSDFGDNLAYLAQDAGWAEIVGPFYVRFLQHDEHETVKALRAYLAEREERDVPNAGTTAIIVRHSLQSKIAKINALIESLPADQGIAWFASNDGSWGAVDGFWLALPEQITDEDRENFGIED